MKLLMIRIMIARERKPDRVGRLGSGSVVFLSNGVGSRLRRIERSVER